MDEKPFIGEMFQLITKTHQILNSVSDVSTANELSAVACQRRWYGPLAVQEAAMLCRKSFRRFLMMAVLGLSLGGCEPYYEGGGSYYGSEVYTSPAPAYYSSGGYYTNDSYYSPPRRYYSPPARYYQPTPRYYYQPRVYQPTPHYYQPSSRYDQSRPDYRAHQNHGWDGHNRGNWDNDHRDGRNDNHERRGGRNGRGDHDGRGNHR